MKVFGACCEGGGEREDEGVERRRRIGMDIHLCFVCALPPIDVKSKKRMVMQFDVFCQKTRTWDPPLSVSE
jgi:hypothetical protein